MTGIGALTPAGNSMGQSWEALKAGESGISNITRCNAVNMAWKTSGELKGFEPGLFLSLKEMNRLDLFVQYAVAAAVMATEDAGLTANSAVTNSRRLSGSQQSAELQESGVSKPQTPKSKITIDFARGIPHSSLGSAGVIIGSSRGGISTIEKAVIKTLGPKANGVSPYLMPATTISMAASYVSQKLGIRGHCLGISNVCASGTNAIGEAFRLIKTGYSRLVLAGGAEAPVCRICVEGYGSSGALSDSGASRPFDLHRDGFVLSEGSCILVLEEYEAALHRGAKIYGEISGYGNTSDAFHITRPDPEGEARAITAALNEAGKDSDEVDYINAHGTATKIGDLAEAKAIEIAFGNKARYIPVSAIKSMTGHMLAASGAFEVAATLMSLKEGVIPPTINLKEKDPACDLNIVTESKRSDLRVAVSNSFGFGGANAVIVLRRV